MPEKKCPDVDCDGDCPNCVKGHMPAEIIAAQRTFSDDVADASCDVRAVIYDFAPPVRIAILKSALAQEECDIAMIPTRQIASVVSQINAMFSANSDSNAQAHKSGLTQEEIDELTNDEDKQP